MSWLKHPEVRKDVETVARALAEKTAERRATASESYQTLLEATVVAKSLRDGSSIKREWFFSSLGIEWDDGDHETWYLTRSPIGVTFVADNVVPWTHWMGRLYTRLKEAIQQNNGNFPAELEYGPPGRENRHTVGPLVQYQFDEGILRSFDYVSRDGTFEEIAEVPQVEMVEQVVPVFGLKDIVELRDITQDDQIRGLLAGIYTLIGGPGTGKTTVALHRIPYLILEQADLLKTEAPQVRPPFFTANTMQVVVWEDHLVPYLKDCLVKLQFADVGVHHIEDWVASRLRSYLKIGKGKDEYQIKDEPPELSRMKLGYVNEERRRAGGLNEILLWQFLSERAASGDFYHDMAEESMRRFRELDLEVRALVRGFSVSVPDPLAGFVYTAAGVEQAVQKFRANFDLIGDEFRTKLETAPSGERSSFSRLLQSIPKFRDRISGMRDDEMEKIGACYPVLLNAFYLSELVQKEIMRLWGEDGRRTFTKHVKTWHERRHFSKADRYFLLWLIHYMTRNADVDKAGVRPLPRYSHTVVDEAQYYHPLVLRFLVQLAMPPLNSMTIVGDLEQKVNPDGLASWDEIGTERTRLQLETNYRWSKSVYEFLAIYRKEANLRVILRPPRNWVSGDGMKPEIVACAEPDDEVDWLVRRVTELRRGDRSMAIVTAHTARNAWHDRLIDELHGCDIRARWAEGEDVRECVEQLILTNYASIVGLEFDAVFLPRCEEVLTWPAASLDALQSAWVALTRAKRYIGISHVGKVSVFDRYAFASYQQDGATRN